MKYIILMLTALAFFTSSCEQPNVDYSPELALTLPQQELLIASVIRYAARPPEKALHFESRFDAQYDEHYNKAAKAHKLEAYYKSNDGYEYLLLSRKAPSIQLKRVAIGIKLKRNNENKPEYYHEVFRTWKFPEEEMKSKGLMLFDLMVKGKNLSPYYPQNSGKEEYIEFPDEHTTFDVAQKRWVSDLEVMQSLEELKRDMLNKKQAVKDTLQ
jgi:hypothetical protein